MTELNPKKEKQMLASFTLKLSKRTRQDLQILCATDNDFQFKYEVYDASVIWASKNKEDVQPIANSRSGENVSVYLSSSVDTLDTLSDYWNCNPTRALHTAVIRYLSNRKEEALAVNKGLMLFAGD